jgi:Nucleotidyltransferase domain
LIDRLVKITEELKANRFPEAQIIFLAGSIVRGEGTPSSDLDLVILYHQLPNAYRESFYYQGFPVECFVHDPETLNYFFYEIDRLSGFCSLANMVMEGIEIPQPSTFSQVIKQQAASVIEGGLQV